MSEMPQPSTEKAQPPGPAEHGRETGDVADGMSFPAGGWRSSIPAGMMRDSGHRRSRFGKGMSCLQGHGPVFTEGGKARHSRRRPKMWGVVFQCTRRECPMREVAGIEEELQDS